MKPAGHSRPAGRRNTVQNVQTGGVNGADPAEAVEGETAPVSPHIELLPFVRCMRLIRSQKVFPEP